MAEEACRLEQVKPEPYAYDGSVSHAYKFTGKERDTETNLDNFGARYYGSGLGRFVTPDWAVKAEAVPYAQFGNPQSLNLYGYGGNNPLSKNDPDGHLASPWHFVITYAAGVSTGHGLFGSLKLAWNNMAVDYHKGSQGTDAASTNMHAMGGTNPDGTTQTATEARAATTQVVTDAMQSGDTALAGHDVIDAATPLHDGHVWDGLGLNADTAKHELGDFFPSPGTVKQAYENEKAVLQGTNPLAPTPTPTPAPPPPPPDSDNKQQ